MPINDELYDRLVHSRAGLIKHEHATVRRVRSVFKSVQAEILGYLIGLDESQLPRFGPQNKLAISDAIGEYMGTGRDEALREIRAAMLAAARRENRELFTVFGKEIPNEISALGFSFYEVPEGQLLAILDQEVLGDFTQSLISYRDKFTADSRGAIDRALGAAAVHGEGIPEISRRLRDVTGRQGMALTMFSRTAIQTAAFRAQDAFYKANSDIIKRKKYTATFDMRTCPICAGYDGREYALDDGPYIPVHAGCRCTYTPVTRSYRELGINRDEIPPSTRWTMDGRVPATMPLDKWIKSKLNDPNRGDYWMDKLSKTWGPNRVRMFKQGKVDLEDLAVRRRGQERIVTMRKLRQRAS